jgi:hypothetical protein
VLARGFGVVSIAVKDCAIEKNAKLAKLGGAFVSKCGAYPMQV